MGHVQPTELLIVLAICALSLVPLVAVVWSVVAILELKKAVTALGQRLDEMDKAGGARTRIP